MRKKIKRHPRLAVLLLTTFVCGCLLVLIAFSFVSSNPSLPATVADNVLRPVFGEQKTLTIESVYFGISEHIKQVKYSIFEPPTALFSSDISLSGEQNTDALTLTPIPMSSGFKKLSGEGEWKTIHQVLFPQDIVMARTFVRPDPTRSYATVALVQFDMKKLGINTEAGTRYPGGVKIPGTGFVPRSVQDANSLV